MRDYLLGIIAVAAMLGIVSSLTGPKSSAGALIKLVGGMYLMFVMIQPLARFDFDAISDYARQEFLTGTAEAASGEAHAREAMGRIIKQECESYIMDKASGYRVTVRADVTVTEDEIPVPESVVLSGSVPAFVRTQLEQIIETDLNIPKEKQIWIGTS